MQHNVNHFVTWQPIAPSGPSAENCIMGNKHHYIKEWRKHRHLSLRKLADRLVTENFEPIISYVSLSRIETGEQSYTQEILEALADALGTSPASLLIFDPTRDDGLLTLWDRIPPMARKQAFDFLESFADSMSKLEKKAS